MLGIQPCPPGTKQIQRELYNIAMMRRTWKNKRAIRDVVLRKSSTVGNAASTSSRADVRKTCKAASTGGGRAGSLWGQLQQCPMADLP